jgi:hypothetical protein
MLLASCCCCCCRARFKFTAVVLYVREIVTPGQVPSGRIDPSNRSSSTSKQKQENDSDGVSPSPS